MEVSIQKRGHCPDCGREQAVNPGMAHHGYTVDFGYFNGVCSGHNELPIEVTRERVDANIARWRAEADRREAEGFQPPSHGTDGRYRNKSEGPAPVLPLAELPEWRQRDIIIAARCAYENAISGLRQHADNMQKVADAYHGKPLIEIDKAANKPAPINHGDKKIGGNGKILKADYAERGRVIYYYRADDGSARKGWMGTQAWRKLADA